MKKGHDEPEILQAATALADALERIERVTKRAAEVPLTTRNQIGRAGEILRNAAESHQAFATSLVALTRAVDQLRTRQNASAESLSASAQRIADRQGQVEALELRFAGIAQMARDIGAQLAAGDPGAAPPEQARAALLAARAQFAATAADAAALATDAHHAGLVDLEKEAHAIRQQLEAMAGKLDRIPSPN